MKKRAGILWLSLVVALITLLVPASLAFAQEDNSGPSQTQALLAGSVFLLIFGVVGLAFYVYISLAFQTMAKKTNTANAWISWIPYFSLFIMPVLISKKPAWWILLMFIPLVNIVIAIIAWMAVAEVRGKPSWWGILIIVPVVNLIVPGYLAWSN